MLRGLPASIVLHAAVIASGYLVLPTLGRDITSVSVIVPIELVEISDVTNIAPRVEREDAEPEEVPPPLEDFLDDLDTIAPEDLDEPLSEEEAPTAPQEPEIIPDPDVVPEPEDEPEAPEEQPEEPQDRPVLEDPPVDPLDDILGAADNLFDRTPREPNRRTPSPPPQAETLQDENPGQATTRRGAGERTDNTARVESFLVQQLFLCWDDVDDLPNPERLNVTFKMTLNKDGTIKSGPTLVDPARAPIGDRAMGVAIDRALRAARRCAPYTLPEDAADYYDDWDEVTLNLGPAFRQ